MKKNYLLLVVFTFCSIWAFAQKQRVENFVEKNKRPVINQSNLINNNLINNKMVTVTENIPAHFKIVTSDAKDLKSFNFNSKVLKTPAASLQVFYPRPLGTYLRGLGWVNSADVPGVYSSWPIIVSPAVKELIFEPYSNSSTVTYTWTLNGGKVDLSGYVNGNNEMVFTGVPNGVYYVPELNGQQAGETATYAYGYYDMNNESVEYQYLMTSSSIVAPITNADALLGGLYVGWQETEFFGPGCVIDGIRQTAILSLYQKPLAPLYVKNIEILIISGTDDVSTAIPAGKTLTLNVRSLNDNGTIGDIIATSTASASNITSINNFGYITFNFGYFDDLGIFTPRTLLLDKTFIVELAGYDQTYDFKVLIAANREMGGSAYSVHGNTVKTFNWDDGSNAIDLWIQLNGAYNCLEFESGQDKCVVDNNGGEVLFYNEVGGEYYYPALYSSLPAKDLKADTPDTWLTFEGFDETNYENSGVLVPKVSGTALPADITGRTGRIVIVSEGIKTTLYVKQGNVDWPTAISSVQPVETRACRQGDNFELSYPAAATSVSVYTIAGQRIADHKLNPSGAYTLPVANWAKGVYILKFNGANSAVKILK
jgi:hypothetical protein